MVLHVRWFDAPGRSASDNLWVDYYQRVIAQMEENIVVAMDLKSDGNKADWGVKGLIQDERVRL